jgi:hypothetical protein
MAHWKKSFPSKFLQAADLDQPIVATIARVANENVGSDDKTELKPVLFFREPGLKGVVLNLTRAEATAEIAGNEDMDDWPGTRVRLVRGTTRYQGKKVPCIAIERPPVAKKGGKPGPLPTPAADLDDRDFDDDIDDAMPGVDQ